MKDIELNYLTAGYAGRIVLTGVDAAVPAGSWLAVIGPNGAGKSTLLKAIAGLVDYTGQVRIGGTEISTLSNRKRARLIGYVPQNPTQPEGFSVTDYVLLGRTPHLGPLARESRADLMVVADVLRRMDLHDLADRPLQTLSGGERQRAVLARGLAGQADVLLLDEPTTGLDIGHAQALLELVDRLRTADGTTIVTTLHDLSLAAQYPDQLMLMGGGKVVAAGPPHTVLTTELLGTHYGAKIEMLTNSQGDSVVAPVRPIHRQP